MARLQAIAARLRLPLRPFLAVAAVLEPPGLPLDPPDQPPAGR